MSPHLSRLSSFWWIVVVLLCLGVGAVFAGTLSGDFVAFDDDLNIYLNPHLGVLNWDKLRWALTDSQYVRRYMPLAWLCNLLITTAQGIEPAGFHFFCVLTHVANAALVALLARTVLSHRLKGIDQFQCASAAALCSFWWAIHPLRVEVVAWISGLHYNTATTLFLIACWTYLRARAAEASSSQLATRLYAVSAAAFATSLLIYPVMLGGIAFIAGYEIWCTADLACGPLLRLRRSLNLVWVRARWWILASVAIAAVQILASLSASARWQASRQFQGIAPLQELPYLLSYYAAKIFWPSGLAPVTDALVARSWLEPGFFLGSVAALAANAWGIWRFRMGATGSLAFAVAIIGLLVPAVGWTEEVRFPADRYMHGASVAVAVAAAFVLLTVRRGKKVYWVLCVAGTMCLLPLTLRLEANWKNTETLLRRSLMVLGPDSLLAPDIAHRLASHVAFEQLQPAAAMALLKDLYTNSTRTSVKGRYIEVAGDIRSRIPAAERVPSSARVLLRLAEAGIEAGRVTDAIMWLRRAVEVEPDFWQARFRLALLLLQRGSLKESQVHFEKAVGAPGAQISAEDAAEFRVQWERAHGDR
jgi:protein O-mannosyl-transferase